MSMNKSYISGLLIALGLLALGLCLRSGLAKVADRDRVVTVRGLAEKEVQANKVTWPIVYQALGNDLASIYNNIEASNATITAFLNSRGITAEEISINAPTVDDRQANAYASNISQYRYASTQVITVTSNKVDQVRKIINEQGQLMKQGIAIQVDNYQYATIYEYTGLNDIKPDMIAEATHNAREAAQKFADDSGSKIGKIQSAQQGQFSISDRDPYTPYIKNVRVVTSLTYSLED